MGRSFSSGANSSASTCCGRRTLRPAEPQAPSRYALEALLEKKRVPKDAMHRGPQPGFRYWLRCGTLTISSR